MTTRRTIAAAAMPDDPLDAMRKATKENQLPSNSGFDFSFIDFTQVSTNAFDPAPEGTYYLLVKKIEQKESSKKGTPYISWSMEIAEDHVGGKEHAGKNIWHNSYITPNSMPFLFKFLSCLVFYDENDNLIYPYKDKDFSSMTQKGMEELFEEISDYAERRAVEVYGKVGIEVYNNKTRNTFSVMSYPVPDDNS